MDREIKELFRRTVQGIKKSSDKVAEEILEGYGFGVAIDVSAIYYLAGCLDILEIPEEFGEIYAPLEKRLLHAIPANPSEHKEMLDVNLDLIRDYIEKYLMYNNLFRNQEVRDEAGR
ncbi:MAG: hypothetical protein NT076_01500 [Candidatus Pacearchaeota archaeon]|nr:hypothetical protein [Candidatus Pacearchaeota archaeon]